MQTYITILRAINVSGQKLMNMKTLQKSFESIACQQVVTYLQSGNVIYKSKILDLTKLEIRIKKQIEKDFGFDVPILVLTLEKLKSIIEQNPLLNEYEIDESFLHVTFLYSKLSQLKWNVIEEKKLEDEKIKFTDSAIYLYCPSGYGKTKLNNGFIETKTRTIATTRNWRTSCKLLEIAMQLQ